MSLCLSELGVAVIGGDSRQVMVAEALIEQAAWVRVLGLVGVETASRLFTVTSVEDAVRNTRVVVFPISGVSKEGKVRNCPGVDITIDQSFLLKLEPQTLIVTGSFPTALRAQAQRLDIRILEYAERDEIAVPNAIPTAEGAIQLAMENTGYTINGSACLVLGYGRVSRALAGKLLSLGAKVIVGARNPKQREEAVATGCNAIPLNQLDTEIEKVNIVFNSIPAPVLTADIINKVAGTKDEFLIIDLASSPGGTDFDVAEKVGIKAFLALGLPGKVAPLTAGRILASNLPGLIEEELNKNNQPR